MFVAVYKSGGHQYCRLSETYRDENGKVKTKVIKNFGRVDLLLKSDPNALDKLKAQYGGSGQDKIEQRGKVRSESLHSFLSAEQQLPTPESFPCLNYGYYVLKALWNSLGLNRKLTYLQSSRLKIEFDLNTVVSFLVFSKVLDPHSVRFTFSDKDFFLGDPMKGICLQNCYDSLGILKEHKDRIFKAVNQRLDEEYGKDRSLLIFYDVTNVYFESPMTDEEYGYKQKDYEEQLSQMLMESKESGELGDEFFNEDGSLTCNLELLPASFLKKVKDSKIEYLLMRGPSKEHRFDLPLVSVALVIDRNGFPLDFEIYSGNASEFKTMTTSIDRLTEKYHTKETIIVADRGLNSASNLKMLQEHKLGFLMAQKVSAFSGELLDKMLETEQYRPINKEVPEYGRYRVIKDFKKFIPGCKDPVSCTLVLTYNEQRRLRDEAVLDRQVEKVLRKAEKKEKISPSSSNCAELAKVDGDSKTARVIGVDHEAVAKRRARCGYAAMVYKRAPSQKETEPSNAISDDDVAGIYHQLTKIEECFKIMKNHLGLRPMYVWNSDHVRGHVIVCVLALLLLRMLQRKLKDDLLADVSIDDLCRALNEANVMFMKPSANECVFIHQMSRTQNIRRKAVKLSDQDLLTTLSEGMLTPSVSIISRCMQAVGLTPIKGIVNRPDLAHCLKTRFDSDEEVVSPVLLRQLYPSLYTTM